MTSNKKYSFLLLYVMVILPVIGLHLGGWLTFFPFLILFTIIPLIDAFIRDAANPSEEQQKELEKDVFFKYVTYLYVPAQILLIAYGVYTVSSQPLSWYEWLGFTMSIGLITGGAGITLAHEMLHKNNRVPQFLSKILLGSVCYGHFYVEHVKGHHVKVATPEDPATAQLGESLYHFLPKTLIGSIKSAIKLEKNRLDRKLYSFWNIHNHFWWIISIPLLFSLISFFYGGLIAFFFFILQSFVAILMLETVNYIEHYGLERKKLTNGNYEKVSPYHSWNANHWLSNILSLHLQRHSDHHTYGSRPYQILRHMDQSPQLPSGYLGMIALALIPPLWRVVMDKRVLSYRHKMVYE